MPYAAETKVPVGQSMAEIQRYLTKKGASAYMHATDQEQRLIGVQFRYKDRSYRFVVQMPDYAYFAKTKTGQKRAPSQIETAIAQEERRIWRALLLVLKAKFESVESGIETFEEAFLPQTVLPGNAVVGKAVQPLIDQAYEKQDPTTLQNLLPHL